MCFFWRQILQKTINLINFLCSYAYPINELIHQYQNDCFNTAYITLPIKYMVYLILITEINWYTCINIILIAQTFTFH